jgi:hypothetical protein
MPLLIHPSLIFLPTLVALISCQNFKSGITSLTPSSPTTQNTYSLNYNHNTNDLIISISSFSFETNTSCFIAGQSTTQSNFTCSSNVKTVAYLFYEKTGLIYSNTFSYYFFEGNHNYSVVWYAPINLTAIARPQLRAMLSGFKISNSDQNTLIDLRALPDG